MTDDFTLTGESYTTAEVLARFHDGPLTGIFTDGSARPNPGPGGWGMVYVKDNTIISEAHGKESPTTNNRMELTALIEAFKLIPPGEAVAVYTDSELCVNTITKWASAWAARGWKRKTGPIKNLELVQELYRLARERPKASLQWVKAHNGWRWNEYADSLSTAWSRKEL
jgi:ribonuclease HI